MTQENNDQRAPSRLRARLQQSRHDTRGIALQTIIIMVVLLAIAGAVAAVLFSRASEETDRLEDSESVEVYAIESDTLCRTAGHTWENTITMPTSGPDLVGLNAVGITSRDDLNRDGTPGKDDGDGYCKPKAP